MDKEFDDFEIEYDDKYNPTINSPYAPYALQFYQTRETMLDTETYKRFLDNAISQFRKMVFYKHYKGYLMGLGLDHCQVMPGVTSENVGDKGIEMNHNFLTIFDIALLLTEHVLNTVGYICTFNLIHLLRVEHQANRIPIVMLNQTVHQIYHNSDDMVFPAQMCFGYWIELLLKYSRGITPVIAKKVINYINRSIDNEEYNANVINDLLSLRDNVEGWSRFNECGENRRIGVITTNNYQYNYNQPYIEEYIKAT